jgi:glycine hydroxymethyltransferase
MSLDAGGHLTHSSSASFVSKLYNVVPYGLDDNGFIDYNNIEMLAHKCSPKLIVAGASAYSRQIDFKRFREISDSVGAYLMVDMAHIAGLVAAGYHPSPFGIADIITTTTHKTLRGPRGGLIFCKPELAKKVDTAVFPRCQGGSLQNVIAAKAVCAEEALDPSFKEYIKNVVENCAAMAKEFERLGYKIVSGGTDNHLFLLDLTGTNVTGAELQDACDKEHITLNKNAIPNDPRSPKETSGVRIGTAPMTTKGFNKEDFINTADKINKIIQKLEANKKN